MGLYFLSPGAGLRPSDIVYDREGSAFALAGAGDFDWDALLDGADLLHLSGITPALGPRSAEAAKAAAARRQGEGRPHLLRRQLPRPAVEPLGQRSRGDPE